MSWCLTGVKLIIPPSHLVNTCNSLATLFVNVTCMVPAGQRWSYRGIDQFLHGHDTKRSFDRRIAKQTALRSLCGYTRLRPLKSKQQ